MATICTLLPPASHPSGMLLDDVEPLPPSPFSTVTRFYRHRPSSERLSKGQEAPKPDAGNWGWFPTLSLVGALGLLLVAIAYTGARFEAEWAELGFWAGLLVLVMPITMRLASTGASRRERIGLVTVAGLGLYIVKILHSPVAFTFHDEFVHSRTALDIVQSSHLFQENSIIPISPLFPGLEIVTTSLVNLGGMPIFSAGVVVLGVARLVLVLALYLFYEQVSRSARVAGVATLLYMANPSFVFFDAQFSYESLALPFAALVIFAAARRGPDGNAVGLNLAAVMGIVALVATHHLATYALDVFLVLWAIVPVLRGKLNESPEGEPGSGTIALLAVVASVTWVIFVAGAPLIDYLSPYLVHGTEELLGIITGQARGRQLFHSFSGQVTPLYEQLAGYVSVVLILLGLPFGVLQIWRRRGNTTAFALAVGALAYPGSLPFHLTYWGVEAANRSSGYLFVAIAFVLAYGVEEFWSSRQTGGWWRRAFTCWATLIFLGGVVVGLPLWARLPGPYLVAADTRSIEPQGVAAAQWMHTFVGPGSRVSTDRVNGLLMTSYGEQHIVTAAHDGVLVAPVFFSLQMGADEWTLLRLGQVQHIVVDRRLSSGLPMAEAYFERGEPDTYRHRTPIAPAALAKFDGLENVSRLFDSGDIQVYDVGELTNAP